MTLTSSVQSLLQNEDNTLKEINENLKQLMQLQQREVFLKELKLKLKYPNILEN